MLTQKACFNSPVWFNVGVKEARGYGWGYERSAGRVQRLEAGVTRPQCSACFIVSVKDSLESILDLAKTEGMLFKWGSGTGTNLSSLREEDAVLSGGGRASGPLSFMKGFDAFAGVIKSGGKTRRAAKMVILNAEHPDIEKFIWAKAKEEKKAYTLVEAGYDSSLDGEAYSSVFFQNANNSVRATDDFMQAVVSGGEWWTKSVTSGQPVKRHMARDLMRKIAEATHQCGDPGMQFDTTVNRWNPCKNTRAHQRLQPLLGVHVPRRFGVQPFVVEPDEVRQPRRAVRRGGVSPRGGHHDPGAGDHRGQRQLPDREDRRELAQVPAAGAGFREPGRARSCRSAFPTIATRAATSPAP